MNTEQILDLIKNSKKKTPVKVYLQGSIDEIDFGTNSTVINMGGGGVVFGDWEDINQALQRYQNVIEKIFIESDRRNSAIGLLDFKNMDARIEPGAIIREGVTLEKDAIIMMGACVNIGVTIGSGTLIDMNAVVGGRAQIGKKCHIGAGVVIKGVISSPNASPVRIDDEVLVGPNAVIMEGIHVGKGAIIPAGSVVTRNVQEKEVYK
jgi:tetrahydrodipicolinate N-acetyltransferase